MPKTKSRNPEEQFQCPLCGHKFYLKEADQCQTCAFKRNCDHVMCPKCHYELPLKR
ncbi:MAG TPA: hypothetical protein VEH86_03035 [Candidatus Acidoferrum sp.]|nr:hypothetical protein [Candidatus Acidoferrum sp.]